MKTQKTATTLKSLRKEFGKVREDAVRRESQAREVRNQQWQKAVRGESYSFKL